MGFREFGNSTFERDGKIIIAL